VEKYRNQWDYDLPGWRKLDDWRQRFKAAERVGWVGFRAHDSAKVSAPCRTNSGVNCPRQPKMLLRVLWTTSSF